MPNTPDSGLLVQWIVGGLVVLVYASDRFRSPRAMRATTTFWRYWSAWCGYIVTLLGLFVVLGGGITGVDPNKFLPMLGGDSVATTSPGPLLSALLLTSLLPHVPVLAKIDEAVMQWFRRVGNIPFAVRELSGCLRAASYKPPAEALDQLLPIFRMFGVDKVWLEAPPETIRRRWARSVALYAQVQHWEDARDYTQYVDEHKVALREIGARLNALAETLDARAMSELDRESKLALVARMRKQIERDLTTLERALGDFVSGGVLSGGLSHAQRHAALTQLGFSELPSTSGPLTANDLVLVMGLVFLAMLFIPLMMRRFFDPTPLRPNVRALVMVPIIYTIAIVVAIYPKSVWQFARRQSGTQRPMAAYVLSGVVAAMAAFVVSLLFRFAFAKPGNVLQVLATPGAFLEAWNQTVQHWPWLLMSFSVTVALAWAADDNQPDSGPVLKWLRWAESGALAAIVGATQWTVVQLLLSIVSAAEADDLTNALPRMIITASVIGACVGWFVPHLYRVRSSRERAIASTMAGQPPPGASTAAGNRP